MNNSVGPLAVNILATLTIFAQAVIVFLIIVLLLSKFGKKNSLVTGIVKFYAQNSLSFAFLVALVATAGSLFLSEFAHFTPCKLCWYQRICMYPQVLLLGFAAIKNDFNIKKYVLGLSVVGLVISTYHYLLQMSPLPLPCTDEVANCALKQVAPYGYVTIPMMAGTAFLLIIILMLFVKKK